MLSPIFVYAQWRSFPGIFQKGEEEGEEEEGWGSGVLRRGIGKEGEEQGGRGTEGEGREEEAGEKGKVGRREG